MHILYILDHYFIVIKNVIMTGKLFTHRRFISFSWAVWKCVSQKQVSLISRSAFGRQIEVSMHVHG